MMVDTDGAARHLCLAPNTLEKLRVTGGGPKFAKLGRAVRYRISDLDRWVEERMCDNTSEPC